MDTLGDRMKNYENVNRYYLTARLPIILRIDGKNFSNYTKCFNKPYDECFLEAMRRTAKSLCEEIDGCRFAYTQSDEISLLLINYDNLNTQGWLANNIQKMVSISASMAAIYFYRHMCNVIDEHAALTEDFNYIDNVNDTLNKKYATFDCRCFVLPKEEVTNYFWWRQLDCDRNAVNGAARCFYSHKDLDGKTSDERISMLRADHNIEWERDYPSYFRKGTSIYKDYLEVKGDNDVGILRTKWFTDTNPPFFINEREYITKYI